MRRVKPTTEGKSARMGEAQAAAFAAKPRKCWWCGHKHGPDKCINCTLGCETTEGW